MDPQTIAVRPEQGAALTEYLRRYAGVELALTMQGDGSLYLASDMGPSWAVTPSGEVETEDGEEVEV